MKRAFLIFSIVGFIVSALWVSSAQAITIRIDKPKVRLAVAPGESKSDFINIENPSSSSILVRVYLEDWLYSNPNDGSKAFYPPGTLPFSCAKWITFAPAEFTIPPYGRQAVNFTVNCPADAEGGHYAVMFIETALGKAEDEEGVSVAVYGRLGSLFCIEPKGTIKRKTNLSNLLITKNKGIEIKLEFENTGNIDIAPEATFYIMDKSGLAVARGEFNQVYTLAGDKARISSSISEATAQQLLPGEYDLIITVDLGGIPEVLETKLKISATGGISY